MNKAIFWVTLIVAFVGFLILVSNTLTPFFIAFIIAYILQPIIGNIIKKSKLPRNIVAYGVFTVFLGVFILAFAILLPILYQQVVALVGKIPLYKNYIQNSVVPVLTAKIDLVNLSLAQEIQNFIQNFINTAFSLLAGTFNNIWVYTIATINVFTIILFVPIILIYLLRDWSQIVEKMEELMPVKNRNKIHEILSSINSLLSAYIRGQLNVCVLLSAFYGIGLTIIGMELGLLLGSLSGFLIIIPFIGTFISFLLVMTVGYFSFGFTAKLGYIVILYIFGYLAEGYILTPKIIGDRIGLHPLWIMFAVFACGSVLGFAGIFFAIPIAGIIKVLLGYAIEFYKTSKIYKS